MITSRELFQAPDQTAYGAAVTGTSADVLIKKCTFNRNTSTGFGSGFNSGFAAQNGQTTNIVFDSCQFNDTTVTLSDSAIATFFGATWWNSITWH